MNRFSSISFSSASCLIIIGAFFLMITPLLFLSGCGGAKKTMQIETQRPTPAFSETEPLPAATAPMPERADAEKASVAPATLFLSNIYFDFDRYNLMPEALETLTEHARMLQAYPEVSILIEGHCDERGTVEYNLALGDKRAKTTKDYLVSLGVSSARISTISYGKEQAADWQHNEEAWAKNRRAEFKVRHKSET